MAPRPVQKINQPVNQSPPAGALEDPGAVRGMFTRIAGRYDLTNALLSGGLDRGWRRRATALVREWQPASILDLATGSGVLAAALAAACPGSAVTGADFCAPMLRAAQRRGLTRLVVADAMDLPFADASFDALTVAFGLRNMAGWDGALREMRRVLRPGGHLLVLDFSLPRGWLRAPYRFYLHHFLPRIAGAVCGEREAYRYLGQSIERFPRGAAMVARLEQSGFRGGKAEELSGGIVSIYTAAA